MKKIVSIIDKLLSPSLFAICYLPYLALNMLTVVNVLGFTRIFLALFAAWGVCICVRTFLFSGKNAYLEKYTCLLIGFLALCLVSQLVNFGYGGFGPIGKLAFFALCILVLYTQYNSDIEKYKKTLCIATRTVSVVITLAILASLSMFVHLFTATIVGRSGAQTYVGVAQNRLYGVFSSPNVGGMYALILIWCAIYNIYTIKKSKLTPAWITISIFQILISVCYIALSLSRGTYLAGIVFIIAFCLLRKPFRKELALATWKQITVRIVSALAVLTIAICAIPIVHTACCKISEMVAISSGEDKSDLLEKLYSGHEGRVENDANVDITNKRKDIWLTHLSLVGGKNLIFGINEPLDYYNKNVANGVTFENSTKTFVEWADGNMHNGYLQILVHCGIPALIAMLAFLVLAAYLAIRFIILALKDKTVADGEKYKLFSLCMPMVLTILANNVVETNFVLMGANFFQAVFWFAAGACIFCIKPQKEKK